MFNAFRLALLCSLFVPLFCELSTNTHNIQQSCIHTCEMTVANFLGATLIRVIIIIAFSYPTKSYTCDENVCPLRSMQVPS